MSLVKGNRTQCISANGKDSIVSTLKELNIHDQNILICADAAALGSCRNKLMKHVKSDSRNNYYFSLLPESFEWLILSSELFINKDNIRDKIEHPENYVDITTQFSWENYFTDLFCEITKQDYHRDSIDPYKKSTLVKCYVEDCCLKDKEPCSSAVYGDKKKIILGKYADKIDFSDVKERGNS